VRWLIKHFCLFKAHGPESDIDALCVGPCITNLPVTMVVCVPSFSTFASGY
jgi:hypothetical protein